MTERGGNRGSVSVPPRGVLGSVRSLSASFPPPPHPVLIKAPFVSNLALPSLLFTAPSFLLLFNPHLGFSWFKVLDSHKECLPTCAELEGSGVVGYG